MADNNSQNKNDSTLSRAASAAGAARGAMKAGKALAGAAKGAAAGPYGMVAAGLWENRKLIGKILAAAGFLLMIPVLFIMMLPSLIFGNRGLSSPADNVLTDNSVILSNIAEIENSIEEILREKHAQVLTEIENEASGLGDGCEYEIIDEFSESIVYESTLIISQFCASQDNYESVNLEELKSVLRQNLDGIFSYSSTTESIERLDEVVGSCYTITHYTYTVEYTGDSYFRENVFMLSEDQAALAEEYAANLQLFLSDTHAFPAESTTTE